MSRLLGVERAVLEGFGRSDHSVYLCDAATIQRYEQCVRVDLWRMKPQSDELDSSVDPVRRLTFMAPADSVLIDAMDGDWRRWRLESSRGSVTFEPDDDSAIWEDRRPIGAMIDPTIADAYRKKHTYWWCLRQAQARQRAAPRGLRKMRGFIVAGFDKMFANAGREVLDAEGGVACET